MAASLTAEQLLDVWRRVMDEGYSDPIETVADGRGLDLIHAIAAMFVRASLSVELSTQALYLKEHSIQTAPPASGGAKALMDVDIERDLTVNADSLLLVAGTEVAPSQRTADQDLVEGPRFTLLADVALNSAGPFAAEVEAVREGFQGNIRDGVDGVVVRQGSTSVTIDTITPGTGSVTITSDDGRFSVASVGQFVKVTDGVNSVQPPARITAFTDPFEVVADISSWAAQAGGTADVLDAADLGVTVTFRGPTESGGVPTRLGRSAELDLLAREFNQGRAAGEGDDSLRQRLCDLGDVVSPNALVRGLAGLLTPLGCTFVFSEVGTQTLPGFVFDRDAFDNPRAYRRGAIWAPGGGVQKEIGFLVVLDGTQLAALPDPPDVVIGSIVNLLRNTKAGGVPFAIAFEPPLP